MYSAGNRSVTTVSMETNNFFLLQQVEKKKMCEADEG